MKDVTWDILMPKVKEITSLEPPRDYTNNYLFTFLVQHLKVCVLSADLELTKNAIEEFEDWYKDIQQ